MFSPQYVTPGSGNGKVWKCRQLQTFRVMQKERGAELISANLGATICDKGKQFFWSRKWHESGYGDPITFTYPALLLTELSFSTERPFQKQTKRCYNYQIAVVDQQSDDCKTCACESCEKRTVNEIFADTEALLFDALYYLSGVKGASLQDCPCRHRRHFTDNRRPAPTTARHARPSPAPARPAHAAALAYRGAGD